MTQLMICFVATFGSGAHVRNIVKWNLADDGQFPFAVHAPTVFG